MGTSTETTADDATRAIARFSLDQRPEGLVVHRKRSTVQLAFVSEPFIVETQEGPMAISPETVDDWRDGYFIAYPDDGSKPYAIAPAYVHANYLAVVRPHDTDAGN